MMDFCFQCTTTNDIYLPFSLPDSFRITFAFAVRLGGNTPAGVTNSFMRYDIADRSWLELSTPIGMAGRFGHSAAVSGDKMFVWGGVLASGEATNELWYYDFSTSDWTIVGPRSDLFLDDRLISTEFEYLVEAVAGPQILPQPSFGGFAVSAGLDENLYLGGGEDGTSIAVNMSKFTTASRSYDARPAGPFARFDAAHTVVGGRGNEQLAMLMGGDGKEIMRDAYAFWVGDDGVEVVRA